MTEKELELEMKSFETKIDISRRKIYEECHEKEYNQVDKHSLLMLSVALTDQTRDLLKIAQEIDKEQGYK